MENEQDVIIIQSIVEAIENGEYTIDQIPLIWRDKVIAILEAQQV